jgi:hypothetical protein
MPPVGSEPTIPVSERSKTFHAVNCAAAVTGLIPSESCGCSPGGVKAVLAPKLATRKM